MDREDTRIWLIIVNIGDFRPLRQYKRRATFDNKAKTTKRERRIKENP
jgi:hypothetical protein